MSRLKKINKRRQVIYERTREEREPSRYPGLIYLLIIIILFGLSYVLFFSGLLDINNVIVEGYSREEYIRAATDDYRSSNILTNNILFINLRELEDRLGDEKRIKALKIKRELPNSLKIEIEESSGVITWITAGENYIVDDRGYVIEKNSNSDLVPVSDNANIPIDLGERVASPTFIKYIIDIWSNFELVTGQEPEKIIILDILSDIHVKSKSGWTVYLDSTKDPISQLENLNKVLQSATESGHTKLQYIDMRLQDKVFYK